MRLDPRTLFWNGVSPFVDLLGSFVLSESLIRISRADQLVRLYYMSILFVDLLGSFILYESPNRRSGTDLQSILYDTETTY